MMPRPDQRANVLAAKLKSGDRVIAVSGLTSTAAKAFYIGAAAAAANVPVTIVTDTNADLEKWAGDLAFFAPNLSVVTLPCFETDIYSGLSPHAETQERRAIALWQLSRSNPDVTIISARSLAMKLPSPPEINASGIELRRDEDVPPAELTEKLTAVGYVREDPVNGIGQFSVRGGIVDLWPPNAAEPYRIEFFGDTIDSIRTFDPETQLSTGHTAAAEAAPMREFAVTADDMREWAMFAEEAFADEKFARNLKDRTDFAAEGETFSGWEFQLPLSKPLNGSIFQLIKDSVLVIDEPTVVEQHLASLLQLANHRYAAVIESGDVGPHPEALLLSGSELRDQIERFRRVELRSLGRTAAAGDDDFAVQ